MSTALAVAVVALAAIALWPVLSYNRFVSQRAAVASAWATVDAELQRRHDLIPPLVEAVRASAVHERATLARLAAARTAASAAAPAPAGRQGPEQELAAATAEVLALREHYPALRADSSFRQLQDRLAITEDRIAAARRFYNSRVLELNHRVQAFPSSLVARWGGITNARFFEL